MFIVVKEKSVFPNVFCFYLIFQECRQILWRSSLLFWEPLPRRVCSTSKRLTGHFAILLYVSLLSSHFSFFRRGSTMIDFFQEEGSLTGRVCHRIWQAGRNQSSFCWGETAVLISCIIIVRAIAMLNNFLSLNRRYTSNNFLDGIWNILSFPLYLIFLHHIPVFKTFDSFQLVEDFQQKAVAAGSEDAASVATLQKCEELLPGEVVTLFLPFLFFHIFVIALFW